MGKSERTRMRERATVPSYLTDQLIEIDRYGLTIDDFQTWQDTGSGEALVTEYQVTAYKQDEGLTAQMFIAQIRYADGVTLFKMNRRFTGTNHAELFTPTQFYARLARLGRLLTRYGMALDEANDALFFYGLIKHNSVQRPVTSLKQAAAVAGLDLPWRLKEDLLRFHCDGRTLLSYEGINLQFVMDLHQMLDPHAKYASGAR